MNVIKPCGDNRSQLTRGIRPYAPCHHRDLALLATTRPTTRRQPGCHEVGHILRLVTLVLRVSQAEEKEGGAEEDGAAAKKTEAGDDAKEGETTEGGAKEDGAAAKGAGNRMPGRALSKKVRSVPRAHALHPWHHPDVDTHMCLHDARRQ